MSETGTFAAQIAAANMIIPIEGASVTITAADTDNRRLIAYLETDMNGKTEPISFETPDIQLSVSPGSETPYTSINVRIDMPSYYSVSVRNVQIFPQTASIQQVEMLPVAEYADLNEQYRVITYDITPQDL